MKRRDRTLRLRVVGQRERRIDLASYVVLDHGYDFLHITLHANGAIRTSKVPAGWYLEIGHRPRAPRERPHARTAVWLTLYAPVLVSVTVRPILARSARAKARP